MEQMFGKYKMASLKIENDKVIMWIDPEKKRNGLKNKTNNPLRLMKCSDDN